MIAQIMKSQNTEISRRNFLKLAWIGTASTATSLLCWSLSELTPENIPTDKAERLKYIENSPEFQEMKKLYNKSGVPMPYSPEYFDHITSQTVDRVDKVKCYAPSTGYESAFEDILKIYYEMSGPDITRDSLHEIKVGESSFGAAEKRLEIPQAMNLPQNQELNYKYAGTLAHEWTHHWDLYPVITSLDTRLKIDLLKAKAVTRHGLIQTFNDCYENAYITNPEDLDPEYNLFYQLGNDLIVNYSQFLAEDSDLLPAIRQAIQATTEVDFVFSEDGKLSQQTLSEFDNWKLYQAGLEVMNQIKSDPENLPEEFKSLILKHIFRRGVISESIASVIENVIKKDYQGEDRQWYVDEKYAMDYQLQEWAENYISLINQRKIDLDELINRVKNPTGNKPPYEIIIGT